MNDVMWTKATYDKLLKEIPKSKLITPATVSERLKVLPRSLGHGALSWIRIEFRCKFIIFL